jgi:predicted transcriptional regulator
LAARSALVSLSVGLLAIMSFIVVGLLESPRYLSKADQTPFYAWALAAGLASGLLTYVAVEETWKPDLHVVARMVEALGSNGSMAKTQLCSKSGLNYTSFQRYLKWMEDRALVVVKASDRDTFSVVLTQKGLESKDAYRAWLGKLSGP